MKPRSILLIILFRLPFCIFLLCLTIVLYDTHIVQGLEISSQFHFKRIKVIIMLFLEIHDLTHNNPRRENGGITARHDRIAFLELHMARQLIEVGVQRIASIPA